MDKKNQILYIAGGSNTYGYGHIRRSTELADYLKKLFAVSFYVYLNGNKTEFPQGMEKLIIGKPYKGEECDLILIDLPGKYAEEAVKHFKTVMPRIPLIAFGYYSEMSTKPDVIVNLNKMHDRLDQHVVQYSGPQYSIIRKEFFKYRWHERASDTSINVMISVGGADVKGMSELIVSSLEKEMNRETFVKYHLILGPLSKQNQYHSNVINLKVHNSPQNIEKIMSHADIAICNGGSMMVEYIFLCKPVIAIPQTDLEEAFISELANNGSVVLIKREEIKTRLCSKLRELINSESKRNGLVKAGKLAIDGHGKDRIIKILRKTLKKYS